MCCYYALQIRAVSCAYARRMTYQRLYNLSLATKIFSSQKNVTLKKMGKSCSNNNVPLKSFPLPTRAFCHSFGWFAITANLLCCDVMQTNQFHTKYQKYVSGKNIEKAKGFKIIHLILFKVKFLEKQCYIHHRSQI